VKHRLTQDFVDARLVALALAFEPCEHIGKPSQKGSALSEQNPLRIFHRNTVKAGKAKIADKP